ncbi:lysophospholipid acyltransferase family protein [Streptomyces sp. NPDC048389]|uniref:lysophospholipid acyltransferase family protein n=1 Tax=Streptomyces sp. NPDC048389 TaxID=3154622 RepID=UPI00345325BF
MADAKVIPFDDDRSRGGGAQRPARRRSPAGGRRKADAAVTGEAVVSALPGPQSGDGTDGGTGGARAQADPVASGARGADTASPPEGAADAEGGAGDGRKGVAAVPETPGTAAGTWDRRIAGGLAFLRRRITGDYEVDEFGYDAELTDQVLMSMLRPMYEKYFRVEVKGIENIPAEGGALVVANHSGTVPLDGLMMQVAVHDNHPAGRHLRLLAADLVFMLPVVNELARKAGHTLACAEDAEMLLQRGEVVGVMPEGFKGIGKPFGERYKLQRFGRGGFVSTALRARAPIVPCSIVGAEEIYPMIGNAKTLARLLGFPYFPITPTFPWLGPLGAVPLPTKWTIQFGEPIATDGYPPEAAEDPMLMFNLTDQVREQIQHTLYKLLVQRRSVFF